MVAQRLDQTRLKEIAALAFKKWFRNGPSGNVVIVAAVAHSGAG
jgi:hypothetical protein